MKTPEDVINRFIDEENVKFNQERDDWVIEAMEEYAKLYHESKVKELNIPAVVGQSELLFAFCTYLEETTNIKPFIYKDRIVNRFIEGK